MPSRPKDSIKKPVWLRRAREGDVPYRIFKTYCGLDADPIRDFRRLSVVYDTPQWTLRSYAQRFEWAARAQAWDMEEARVAGQLREAEVKVVAASNVNRRLDTISECRALCDRLRAVFDMYATWPRVALVAEQTTPDGTRIIQRPLEGAGEVHKIALAWMQINKYEMQLRDEIKAGADVSANRIPRDMADAMLEAAARRKLELEELLGPAAEPPPPLWVTTTPPAGVHDGHAHGVHDGNGFHHGNGNGNGNGFHHGNGHRDVNGNGNGDGHPHP